MSIERLADVQEEMVDSADALITHLIRFKILCGKAKFPPELIQELDEFVTDWGNNLTKFGDLLKEQGVLLLPLVEDLKKDTEKRIAELEEAD